jgi:hypothetical protein
MKSRRNWNRGLVLNKSHNSDLYANFFFRKHSGARLWESYNGRAAIFIRRSKGKIECTLFQDRNMSGSLGLWCRTREPPTGLKLSGLRALLRDILVSTSQLY